MKAHILKNNGGIENLVLEEVPLPQIADDEVLIRVKAVSVNPVDAYVRMSPEGLNTFLKPAEQDPYTIIGWDVAGIVESVGRNCKRFAAGDEVFGLINFAGHGKGYAEFVAAPEKHLAHKPSNVSFGEAAAATLAALTAWQGLTTVANVKAGDRVVIHAAAGGVGHYAVQIARYLGAHVIAVASRANEEFVRHLGAHEFYDYTSEEDIIGADVVVDSIGGDHIFKSIQSLKQGGTLVSLLSYFEGNVAERIREKNIKATRMIVKSDETGIAEIARLLEKGNLRTHIAKNFKFNEMRLAHQEIETRRTKGKIVVTLQ